MNVLILSLVFSPDNVSTAQIMAALAEGLQARGMNPTVITTTPHYHRDAEMEAAQPLRPWLGRVVQRSHLGKVPVYHIWMPNKAIWAPLRMVSWIWFHALSVLLAWTLRLRPACIVTCSPPITMGVAARIAARGRVPYIYTVQELYPDIAVNLGYLKAPWLIACVSKVERWIYRGAAAVTSITPAMCEKIRQRTAPEKVHLIPNFVAVPSKTELEAWPKEAHADLVITYAGNMGVPQYLGLLVEALPELEGVRVRFIGDGGDKARLMARAKELGVLDKKVFFEAYRPLTEMPAVYAQSDLFYVAQSPEACSDGIPSKIYRILGHRKPLLVVTKATSDLARFVEETGGGVVVPDFTPHALADAIRKLKAHPEQREAYANAGYEAVCRDFAQEAILSRYAALIQDVAHSAD